MLSVRDIVHNTYTLAIGTSKKARHRQPQRQQLVVEPQEEIEYTPRYFLYVPRYTLEATPAAGGKCFGSIHADVGPFVPDVRYGVTCACLIDMCIAIDPRRRISVSEQAFPACRSYT